MCGIWFDLEEEQLAFIQEYASKSERELQQKEIDEHIQEDIIEISDNKEGPLQYNSKRHRSIEPVEEPENKPEEEPMWEEEPDLPEQNTQRVSERVWKYSKLLDGYEI